MQQYQSFSRHILQQKIKVDTCVINCCADDIELWLLTLPILVRIEPDSTASQDLNNTTSVGRLWKISLYHETWNLTSVSGGWGLPGAIMYNTIPYKIALRELFSYLVPQTEGPNFLRVSNIALISYYSCWNGSEEAGVWIGPSSSLVLELLMKFKLTL